MSTQAADSVEQDPMTQVGIQVEQLTRQTVIPTELGNGLVGGVDSLGHLHVTDLNPLLEKYGAAPRRKTGAHALHDPESFIAYVVKHGIEVQNGVYGTEVYADRFALTVTAVLNGDSAESPGWADHRASYALRLTPAWQAWIGQNGKWLTQRQMAEHFEDRLPDIIEPDGATMLELAQSIKATRSGQFQSSQRLANGQINLVYTEQVDGTAQNAAKQSIAIPETFAVQLQPFEGSDAYRVTCRFRYNIADGKLQLLYKLDRPEEVLREAFEDVVKVIQEGITQPIWSGAQP